MLLFTLLKICRGVGNVEAFIAVRARERWKSSRRSYQRSHLCCQRKNSPWHLPLGVRFGDFFFSGASSKRQTGVSLKVCLGDTRIRALIDILGVVVLTAKIAILNKCGLLKFWFRLALVSPHIHLYCLGRGSEMGTYRKRYYLINKCVPGKVPFSVLWCFDISGC